MEKCTGLIAVILLSALSLGMILGRILSFKKDSIKKYEDLPYGYKIKILYKDEESDYVHVAYVNDDGSLEKDQVPFIVTMEKSFSKNYKIGDVISTNL